MWIFHGAKYKFLQMRHGAYVVSGALILAGIAAMVFNVFTLGSWQNYGVDFTGGTLVQVRFADDVTAAELRSALGGEQAPRITRFGEANEFVIRAPLTEAANVEARAAEIEDQLAEAGVGEFTVTRTELVSPTIGQELQQKAALAIIFSFVLTLIYLAIRFELRFGMAAVITTVHDILITLGFLSLFRIEIALPTVAAILTVIGYSLNDTIVVFDRIRENLNKKGGRREDPVSLINRSINENLPRTVMTSVSTLGVLLALLVLGGSVIRDFTIVLILGVVIGTYSSIFVASPALLEIQNRWSDKEKTKKKRKKREAKAVPV